MDGPDRGGEKGGPEIADDSAGERVDQKHIREVQNKIDPVIASRVARVSQDGVIEEIRKGREGAIESGLAGRPPISVLKDEMNVLASQFAYAGILKQEGFVVEYESRREGI